MRNHLLSILLLALAPAALSAQLPVTLLPTATPQDYRTLWQAGQYQQALTALREKLDTQRGGAHTFAAYIDYTDLLTHVGQHDEAITLLETITASYPLPSFTLRLARLYHYRGRRADYQDLLAGVTRQIEALRGYRLDREEDLALIQLRAMRGEDPQTTLAAYRRLASAHPDYTAAHIAAADLASQRRAFDIAASHYAAALSSEPQNQDALAGLATARHLSGDARYRETLAELLALNPHHPRGLALQAAEALDLNQSEEALAKLDKILATNPNDLPALALQAAALFLADRHQDAQTVRNQALAFNPYASEIPRVSGRIASRHYRFAEGRAFQEQALDLDPQDQQARLLLALDLLRLGADKAARGQLEQVFAADPYNVQAYNLLSVADAIAEFRTLRRGKFVVQLPELEAQIIGDEMLDLLTTAADRYQQDYQLELEDPVLVQVFADHDEFMVRSVGLPGSVGHLGICFGKVVTMDSPRARSEGAMNWRQVLWHEFVHVITLQKTHNRLPRWLSEGISVYEETRWNPAWGQRLDPDFKSVLATGPLPQIADLDGLFTQPQSQHHLLFGYYAAGEFVHFYTQTYGQQALIQSLDAIAIGTPTATALSQAASATLREMDQLFQSHLAIQVAPLAQLPDSASGESPFTIALDRGDEAARQGDIATAATAYRAAHALFPDYIANDAPLRRLVRLYADQDTQLHRKALEQVVAWDADAHAAGLTLAALYAQQENWYEAIIALDRAAAVIPFRQTLLADRAHYLQAAGDLDRAAGDLRKLVYLDSTRQTQHRLALALVLKAQGANAAAKRELLTLLEQTPRFWDAQALLLEIDAEQP